MHFLWSRISYALCFVFLAASPVVAQSNPDKTTLPAFQDIRRVPAGSIESDELSAKLKTAEARRAEAEAASRRQIADARKRIAKADADRRTEEQRRRAAEAEINRSSEIAQRALSQIEQLRETAKANERAVVAAAIAGHKEVLAGLRKQLAEARQQVADAQTQRKEETDKRVALEALTKRQIEEARRVAEAEIGRKSEIAQQAISQLEQLRKTAKANERAVVEAVVAGHKQVLAGLRKQLAEARQKAAHVQALHKEEAAKRMALEALTKGQIEKARRAAAETANIRKHAADAEIKRKAAQAARIIAEQRAEQRGLQAQQQLRQLEAKRKADKALRVAAEAKVQHQAKLAEAASARGKEQRKAESARRLAAEELAQRKVQEAKAFATEIRTLRKTRQALVARHQQKTRALQHKRAEATRKALVNEQRAQRAEAALQRAQAEARNLRLALQKQSATAARLVKVQEERKSSRSAQTLPVRQAKAQAKVAMRVTLPPRRQPDAKACGAADITTKPLPAGQMQLDLSSRCRADQRVILSYANVNFIRKLDSAGTLDFILDCFAGADTQLKITFADATSKVVAVVAQDLDAVTKIALIWQANINLDLHAYEYAAKHRARGHVWAKASNTLEASRSQTKISSRGRGFLSMIDTGAAGGDHVEVYTFWHKRDQKFGLVMTAVDYETRGNNPQGETCGKGEHAQVAYQSITRTRQGQVSTEQGTIASMNCGAKLSLLTRYIRAAVRDLRIR